MKRMTYTDKSNQVDGVVQNELEMDCLTDNRAKATAAKVLSQQGSFLISSTITAYALTDAEKAERDSMTISYLESVVFLKPEHTVKSDLHLQLKRVMIAIGHHLIHSYSCDSEEVAELIKDGRKLEKDIENYDWRIGTQKLA